MPTDFTALDLSTLESVTGGQQPLLTGRAAERVYDALRTRSLHGDRRVTRTDTSVTAGSLSCESVKKPGLHRAVTCDLATK